MPQLTIQQAFDLALQHHQAGRRLEAEQIYRQILAQEPGHFDALHYLGLIAHQAGRNDAAAELIRRAIACGGNYPEAHFNLGIVLKHLGELDQAIVSYRRAIALRPGYAEALCNLGDALTITGSLDEADAVLHRALILQPNYPDTFNNLGLLLREKRQPDEAIATYRQAIARRPDFPEAHSNLGNALKDTGQLDEAVAAYREAIALRPGFPEAHNNLANALKDTGQLDEAIAAYRRAIALKPSYPVAHSNLIYALHYHPGCDAQAIAEELGRWDRQYAEPFKSSIQPHANDRNPDRRLRIGYVSANFKEHAESFFVAPLLENHDHREFEIHCYSSVARGDSITKRLETTADGWHDVYGLSDDELARRIRADGMDVLVDLAMQTAGNRLLVFARKPAPVQVTWLAYPGSTGLGAMDYRLTDACLDPAGSEGQTYSEESVRLPGCYVCYDPLSEAPGRELPGGEEQRPICFGSLNNPCKMNEPTLHLWAGVLRGTPGSRLMLMVHSAVHQERISRWFEEMGVARERLEFVGRCGGPEYLRRYNAIDICLDTLPFNGIATSCSALWMGVPVVSLVGRTAAGRAGLSILTAVGLEELTARTPDEFVRLAVDLAGDRGRLTRIHSTLRDRMQKSSLMDGGRFARGVEDAYRMMWRRWCGNSLIRRAT
jgi:predicted O-linked N-acetylglucosamine transferase (SPINDLY family)